MKEINETVFEVVSECVEDLVHVAYFSNKAAAQIVKQSSFSRHVRETKISIVIFDTANEYFDNERTEKRKRIMAKLTDEEKEILGVKD